MADTHINRIKQGVASAPGTGIAILGAASTGFKALGAAQNSQTFSVLWVDGADWEIATGCTYTDAAGTLSRGTLEDSSTGSRLSLTSAAVMAVILPASRGTAWDGLAADVAAVESAVDGLATVATTGAYADLSGKPTLGTAAATDATDYATALQGGKADTAVQPGAITGSGLTMSTARLLGRTTAGSGAAEEIAIGSGLSMTGGTLSATGGGGGSPGGSSGQIQYNNAGAFGGANNVSVVSTSVGTLNCLAVGDSGANPGFVSVRGSPAVNGPHGLRFWGGTVDGPVLAGYDQGTTRKAGVGFLNFGQDTMRMAITCTNGDLRSEFGGPAYPKPYTTATRPAWANGAVIFDSDLDKLVIGGASAWEVVTSA